MRAANLKKNQYVHFLHKLRVGFVLVTPNGSHPRRWRCLAHNLGERQVRNLEVRGSIPLRSTTVGRLAFAGLPFYAVTYTTGGILPPCS